MILIRILLFPLAVLFDAITRVRNKLFDLGLKPSASFEVPVICVGNLSVGGTGKTPMVEYLLRLLGNNRLVATLSRGYGRTTRGFRIATEADTPGSIGDEPFQLYQKFKGKSIVSVGEERALAIPLLADQYPELGAVLLDDAFQHRFVKPGLSILLTEYSHPFYKDYLMPAGRLRESKRGAIRADMIVVTKCPAHIEEEEMIKMEHAIRQVAQKPVFFTKIRYAVPVSFNTLAEPETKKVVLVTGIATPGPLVSYISNYFTLVKHFSYKDHHQYTLSNVESILAAAKQLHAIVITTEKDKTKLEPLVPANEAHNFFFLPIEIDFIKSGADFDAMVLNYIQQTTSTD